MELVRRLFDAVATRDAETVLSLYDPEIEWDGSRSRWAEVMSGDPCWHGHDGMRKFFRDYYETWESLDDTIEEVIDVSEDAVVVVVHTRARGRASGVEIDWPHHAAMWTVRDGRVVRVVWFRTRDEALAAAGIA